MGSVSGASPNTKASQEEEKNMYDMERLEKLRDGELTQSFSH